MRDPGNELAPRSEQVSPPELTPDQLDLLEDSLEWMGDPARYADLDAMPAPVRERAAAYASILALAREAMPEEDIPPGLLDGILAEAQRSAPAPAVREQGPSLWDRLRRSFLLPGVALAGTAALLLWVARPLDEDTPGLREEAAPAPAAPEAVDERAAEPELQDMAEEPEDRKDRQEEAPPPAEALSATAQSDGEAPAAAKPVRAGGAPTKSMKKEAEAQPLPGLDVPEQKRVDADKDAVRDQLESGDRARHKGRCDLAEADYAAVARSNGPAAERARALAGLGLCREAAGKDSDAGRYFDEARALDSSVEQWLRGEGEPMTKKKAKSSAKSKVDVP